MNPGPLALAADLPLVWESDDTLRIGVEDVVVRLSGLSSSEQRFVSALSSGISAERLAEVTRKCGLSPSERRALVSRLGPAVVRRAPALPMRARAPLEVTVAAAVGGADITWARVFAAALGATGVQCSIAQTPAQAQASGLIVLIERYALPPVHTGPWLGLGVPVLLIRLRDRAILIGPILGIAEGPCLDCCSQDESARDPAWNAITCQVSGSLPPSETPEMALVSAAQAASFIAQPGAPGTRLRLPVLGGRPALGGTYDVVQRRPDCACGGLEALAREAAPH